ncbi:unnamed protein product, partial [Ectocarpus fasciculatus]
MTPPGEEQQQGVTSSAGGRADDHGSEAARLATAEAEFRSAVQREQAALMASGIGRVEATEILLRRLREGGASNTETSNTETSSSSNSGGDGVTSTDNGGDDDDDRGAPQDCFSPVELATLVEV